MKPTTVPSPRTAIILVVALISMFWVSSVRSEPAKDDSEPTIPLIKLEEVALSTAIEHMAREARLNYISDGTISPQAINARWENVSAKTALKQLLKTNDLFLIENPATTVARISTRNRAASSLHTKWISAGTNAPIPLIQFQDVPLGIALANLAREINLNLLVDPNIGAPSSPLGKLLLPSPMVSVRWENITPRQAIVALCENYDLIMTKDTATGGIQIKPGAPATAKPAP